jgi:manganese/zinc/iron transport system substrate-binding protein
LKRIKIYNSLIGFCLFILYAQCNTPKPNDKITILTTTGIIADGIREIVKDEANVISLMGAGVDPHLYKPSHGDIRKIASADIIIYNGNHLEGRMARLFTNLKKRKTIWSIADGVPSDKMRKLSESEDLLDPHFWLDPELWMSGMENIMTQLELKNVLNVRDNWKNYRARIEHTHQKFLSKLKDDLPISQRILITTHDAFYYFGEAYQFKVKGLQGISTSAEYSIKDISNLVNFMIKNKVKAVFVENSVSHKNIKKVIQLAEKRGIEVTLGGELYSDALGDKNSGVDTYIRMLEHNFETIFTALK